MIYSLVSHSHFPSCVFFFKQGITSLALVSLCKLSDLLCYFFSFLQESVKPNSYTVIQTKLIYHFLRKVFPDLIASVYSAMFSESLLNLVPQNL